MIGKRDADKAGKSQMSRWTLSSHDPNVFWRTASSSLWWKRYERRKKNKMHWVQQRLFSWNKVADLMKWRIESLFWPWSLIFQRPCYETVLVTSGWDQCSGQKIHSSRFGCNTPIHFKWYLWYSPGKLIYIQRCSICCITWAWWWNSRVGLYGDRKCFFKCHGSGNEWIWSFYELVASISPVKLVNVGPSGRTPLRACSIAICH